MAKKTSIGYISATINGIKVKSDIKCHSSNKDNALTRLLKGIVVHYTGNSKDLAKNNAKYFQNANRNASAHFFVDDNSIYQSVELRDIAWHCGGYYYYNDLIRNSNSVGIEMCCTAGNYKVSAKTIENTVHLVVYLCEMMNIEADEVDKYVLRHYDITHKKCPAQFVDEPAEWKEFKNEVKKILKAGKKKPAKVEKKPAKKEENVAEKYSGTFPKLPERGYFEDGDEGTQAKNLQKFLNWYGNYGLKVDGIIGEKTIAAVKKFQKAEDLTADGLFGGKSLAKAKTIKK